MSSFLIPRQRKLRAHSFYPPSWFLSREFETQRGPGRSVGLLVRFVANCISGEKPFHNAEKKSKSAIRYFYIFLGKGGIWPTALKCLGELYSFGTSSPTRRVESLTVGRLVCRRPTYDRKRRNVSLVRRKYVNISNISYRLCEFGVCG